MSGTDGTRCVLATQRNAAQRNATQRSATQRNATQRNATQRSATQRSATQRDATYMSIFSTKFHTKPKLVVRQKVEVAGTSTKVPVKNARTPVADVRRMAEPASASERDIRSARP